MNDITRPVPVVRLRVPTEEDARHWHRLFDDPDVMEFHGGPAPLAEYEELTARQRGHAAELGFCLWTMVDENDDVIGFTGAQPWRDPSFGPVGEIEIGWRPGPVRWIFAEKPGASGAVHRKAPKCPQGGFLWAFRQRGEVPCQAPRAREDPPGRA